MKKFIYGLLAMVCLFPLHSFGATTYTDIISVETLTESGLELPVEETFATYTYKSNESGITYSLSNIYNKNGKLELAMSMGLQNVDNPDNLYFIQMKVNEPQGTFTTYAGNEKISSSPFMQEGVKTLNYNYGTDTAVADAAYTFMGIWVYESEAVSIELTWSDEAPVQTPSKPYFVLNSDLGCPDGTTVTIGSDTENATINLKVTINDGETREETLDANPGEYTLNGSVGDVIKIEAQAVVNEDGWQPTDWVSRTYKITNLMLLEPSFSIASYNTTVVLGDEVTLTNPNQESMMAYCINNGPVQTTSERSVTFRIEGNIGDKWTISAYCFEEGCENSDTLIYSGEIITNVCPNPEISPIPGEAPMGTEISISYSYPAETVTYRVNGGEWITSSQSWGNIVTLNEDLIIEAYCSAEAPYVDSETVTAQFTVEVLDENYDVINPSIFQEMPENGFTAETYFSDETVNNAVYETIGREFNGGIFVNGEGYVRTYESQKPVNRIKVDARFSNKLIVYLSDQFIEEADSELTHYTIIDGDFESGEWIEMPENAEIYYFYLTTTESTLANCIERVVVEYKSDNHEDEGSSSAINSLENESSQVIYYDLTGRKISNPSEGIFILIKDGNAKKIIVK